MSDDLMGAIVLAGKGIRESVTWPNLAAQFSVREIVIIGY